MFQPSGTLSPDRNTIAYFYFLVLQMRTLLLLFIISSFSKQKKSSANENGDDGAAECHECFRVLAKKVGILATHRAKLMERYASSEASHKLLTKESDEKHQSEKEVL